MTINNQKIFILTNDQLIRSSLIKELDKKCLADPNTKVIQELGITHGAARVDIAVVNGVIHGYELKSDKDTLARLPNQIEIYNTVLDKVTLVVGKKHLHEAIKIVPDWWGITLAKINQSEAPVKFCTIRKPRKNKKQDNVAIAALLWREEALNILEQIGQASGMRSKNRKAIYQRLAKVCDDYTLKLKVRDQLRARTNWRADLQCTPCGD